MTRWAINATKRKLHYVQLLTIAGLDQYSICVTLPLIPVTLCPNKCREVILPFLESTGYFGYVHIIFSISFLLKRGSN